MPASATGRAHRDTLNLRIKPEERGLIDRAAALTGKTRTDFVLEAARRAAVEALTGRTLFAVDEATYAKFLAALDAPPQPNDKLKRTMQYLGPMGPFVSITRPVLLNDSHEIEAFACGTPPLDEWLKRRARSNAASGASRIYAACAGARLAGFYALAAARSR